MQNSINTDYQTNHQVDTKQVQHAFNGAAKNYDAHALLQRTVVDRLMEAFDHIKIEPSVILDLGSGSGYGAKQLKHRFKKAHIYQADLSIEMLKGSRKKSSRFFSKDHFLCIDANKIPLSDQSVDLVFSSLMLQWSNSPDVVFAEVKRVLKPEGVFVFTTFGPDTLKELRESWSQADGNVHINAFTDMHDIGDALMRSGLDAPVLNVENIVLTYDECLQLMRDLKSIGAHNVNLGRRKTLTGKQRLQKAIQHDETYRTNNKLPATYEVVYGHAWKPSMKSAMESESIKNNDTSVQHVSLEKLKQDLKKRKA